MLTASSCNRFVVDRKPYFVNIFNSLVSQLQDHGTLTLDNFEEVLNVTLMSKIFDGTVKFHSGFVDRIGKFVLNSEVDSDVWNDTGVRK